MNYTDLFPSFPDDANIWIYASDRPLTDADVDTIMQRLAGFLERWTSHGRRVEADAKVLYDRFLIVAGFIPDGTISGCGIDASTSELDQIASQIGVEWASALNIFYLDDLKSVRQVSRKEFRQAVESGEITARTPVFDFGIQSLGALRIGGFEKPAADSWHGKVFKIHPEMV